MSGDRARGVGTLMIPALTEGVRMLPVAVAGVDPDVKRGASKSEISAPIDSCSARCQEGGRAPPEVRQ